MLTHLSYQELRRKAKSIKDVSIDTSPGALVQSVRSLRHLYPDTNQRHEVIHAYTSAITTIWISYTPMVAFCFVIVLFMRKYTLKRVTVKGGKTSAKNEAVDADERNDIETGVGNDEQNEDPEKTSIHDGDNNGTRPGVELAKDERAVQGDTSATNTKNDSQQHTQHV